MLRIAFLRFSLVKRIASINVATGYGQEPCLSLTGLIRNNSTLTTLELKGQYYGSTSGRIFDLFPWKNSLVSNKSLTRLDLCTLKGLILAQRNFKIGWLADFIEALKVNTALRELKISKSFINQIDWQHNPSVEFFSFLKFNVALVKLDMSFYHMGIEAMDALTSALAKNWSLKILNLSI